MSVFARLRGQQAQGADAGPGGEPLPDAGGGGMPAGARPDLVVLDDAQTERVHHVLRDRQWTCAACGGDAVRVGQALYLGFLFRSEDLDAYMVGLSCINPECPRPRDGIRLSR